jgi:hypothetical protein
VKLIDQAPSGAGATLSGGAALRAIGSGHAPAAGSVSLTAAAAAGFGAVEFARVIRPAEDCRCEASHMLALMVYVRMGGGSLPGEGLVISLVDATKQTPGATRFMPGCGVRAALPAHAVSIALDTADSDASCDEPGTGARIVSTLGGAAAPPLVVSSTLEMGTAAFRRGAWTAVQFLIKDPSVRVVNHATGEVQLPGQAADALPAERLRYAPWLVWLDGSLLLDSSLLPSAQRNATTLRDFYVVVSARTGGTALDAHAISGLRLDCLQHDGFEGNKGFMNWIVNWEGLRQPLTPPPFGRPPPPASAPPLRGSSDGGVMAGAAVAAVSTGVFMGTLALMSLAAAAWHGRREHAPSAGGCAAEEAAQQQASLLQPPQPAMPEPAFHAFLSHRRADWRIADAVHDKLRLAGLRVFVRDADGAMARWPFDVGQLLLAVRSAPVFAPVVTLESLQRLAGAATAAEPDASLAEWLAALYFRDAEQAQNRCVRLIHPLLVGKLVPPTHEGASAQWLNLKDDPAYAQALAALPDAVPAATVALVDAALRRTAGAPLPARFAQLTVRQIVCGCDEPPPRRLAGVLSGEPFALECAQADLDLHIGGRYAPALLRGALQ